MYMELDKRDLFLNRPKVTSHKSMKTCIKITERRHFFFFFHQSGVGWARAMDSPREKTSTSHLKQDSYVQLGEGFGLFDHPEDSGWRDESFQVRTFSTRLYRLFRLGSG